MYVCMYASSDNIVNLYDLINRDLDNLTDWFRANKLSLNTSKIHYIRDISPSREINALNQNTIKIASDDIERKDCCKFLGIMIDDKLTWSKHIDYIHSKLSRSLYAINRSRYLVPPKYLKHHRLVVQPVCLTHNHERLVVRPRTNGGAITQDW